MKVIVSGGWSYGNIGDEAIAASTIYLINKYFHNEEIVYTAFDVKSFRDNHGIDSIESVHAVLGNISALSTHLNDIIEFPTKYGLSNFTSLLDSDSIFVMSGGGYFHEQWSSQFFARIAEIEIAKRCGAKVIVIGQSIGPVISYKGREILRTALNKVDYLAVRDKSSLQLLESLHLIKEVKYIPDLAIIISDIVKKENSLKKKRSISIMPASYTSYVGMLSRKKNPLVEKIIKRMSPNSHRYMKMWKAYLEYVIRETDYDINIVLSTIWKWDFNFASKLIIGLDPERVRLKVCSNYCDLCDELSKGILTISTKMHPLIISTSYGIPTIGISYNYKIDDFLYSIDNSNNCFCIDHVNAPSIVGATNDLLAKNNAVKCEELKKIVYDTFDLLFVKDFDGKRNKIN